MAVNTENIFGKDGFVWWIGVVEDRKNDPDKLGRVRVRIMGYHSDDLEVLPTEELPWAIIMQPTTSAAVSGVGQSPTNLVEGTWVIGFFLDGKEKQQPIVIGTFGGMTQKVPFCDQESLYERVVFVGEVPEGQGIVGEDLVTDGEGNPVEGNFQSGVAGGVDDLEGGLILDIDETDIPNELERLPTEAFQDPDKLFPRCTYVDKPDTNKLATVDLEDDDTPVFKKLEYLIEEIPVALSGTTWAEPEPAYCAEYPYNQVLETEAGHVIEYDNTPGKERIHIFHTSGTYWEIDVNGSSVRKVRGDELTVIEKNGKTYIGGDGSITVGGRLKILVQGSCDLEVNGDLSAVVDGDMAFDVKGSLYHTVGGDYNLNVTGEMRTTSAGKNSVIASTMHIDGGSEFAVDAGMIFWNSGAAAPATAAAVNIPDVALAEDMIRPVCELEEPDYLEVEVEDYFVDEGVDGIVPLEYEEIERAIIEEEFVLPPDLEEI